MRVITGSARGRSLQTLPGDATRPTAEKVKEAVFSAIQFDVEGRRVLDLFAGSGQLGIEALSRGAASAVFVDASRQAAEVVRANLQATGLTHNAVVLCRKAMEYVSCCPEQFDIVFLDPPYGLDLLPQLLPLLPRLLSPAAVVICEHAYGQSLPSSFGDFVAGNTRKYGKIGVTMYRKG